MRKIIRLNGYDYSQSGMYFVTMCIKDGHELLGKVVGTTALGRLCANDRNNHSFVELTPLGICVEETIKIHG